MILWRADAGCSASHTPSDHGQDVKILGQGTYVSVLIGRSVYSQLAPPACLSTYALV